MTDADVPGPDVPGADVPGADVPGAEMSGAERPLIAVDGVEKRYGTTRALRGISLSLRPGQCLGLVGRNGAGKSTLVSILSGLVEPDAGTVTIDGEIATVFQHSMIVKDLSVAENVFLGAPDLGRGSRLVNWDDLRARTRDIMQGWGFDIDAGALCRDLSVEQLQVVEIARALARGAKCVLLDEPTAALERKATRGLFERVRQLTEGGVAVLYISHHLEEVFEICTDVAVLRDGELVLAAPVASLTRDGLVAAMVGEKESQDQQPSYTERPAPSAPASSPADRGDVILAVRDLASDSSRGRLAGVSLDVHAGEVVGVTGLLSAGVATLGRVIAGTENRTGGEVRIRGGASPTLHSRPTDPGRPPGQPRPTSRRVPPGHRDAAQRAGIGYIPEDRHAEGLVPLLGVAENTTMTIARRLSGRLGLLTPARRAAAAAPITRRLSLVSSGPAQPAGELSGGNQQKVTVARTLAHDPSLIVAVTPTRGVDVASKELLLGALADVATTSGAGVLLCSDELTDLAICDRVIVLVHGEIFSEFTQPPFDRDELIRATEALPAEARPGEGGPAEDGA
jgi:simple sugar transport system ATP-binding protein